MVLFFLEPVSDPLIPDLERDLEFSFISQSCEEFKGGRMPALVSASASSRIA